LDLRQTQLIDNTPALVRWAPAAFLVVATLAATFQWGYWAGLCAFAVCALLIYRDL
jgi:hypothetical protein